MARTPSRRGLAALVLAAALGPAAAAHAGPADDWSVTRDPFDKGVIARLEGLLARNPNDADALAKLLGMYRRYRTVDLLRQEYDAKLAKSPDDWSTLVVVGRLALAAGDSATALTRFEAADKQKSDPQVAVELGALYRSAGQPDPARAAFTRAAADDAPRPVRMKALRALADLALAAKDIAGARKTFEQYIALDPTNVALRLELGDALAQAGLHDEAIAVFQDAEKRLGTDPSRRVEAIARIGQAQEDKGDVDTAIETYRRAIKLVPRGYYLENELTARIVDIHRRRQTLPALLAELEKEWPVARRGHFEWDTLAHLYEETGQQDAAVSAYEKAVAKAPYELDTQRRLIQLLESVGRDKEAIARYEAVVREAPGEASFQLELAERYRRLGDGKRAVELLKHMEGRFGSDPGVQSSIADTYLRWGEDELALAALARVAKLDPSDPSNLITLGEQYYQRGDKPKAMATWRQIANPHTPAAYAKLGDVLAEHDSPDEGLGEYAKAIAIDGNDPALYRGRSQIYERERNFAAAAADLEKALTLLTKPGDRAARKDVRSRLVALLPHWDGGRHREEYRLRWRDAFAKNPPDLEAGYFLVELYRKDAAHAPSTEPRATLERILAFAPDDQDTILDLVQVHEDEKDYGAAVDLLKHLAAIAPPREREVDEKIAKVMTEWGNHDAEAIDWSQKALAASPNDPAAYTSLAERYVQMQRPDDAATAYAKVIELAPHDFKAYFALAALDEQRGRWVDEAEVYRRVLRQAQDDDDLEAAGRKAIAIEELHGSLGELEKVVAPLSTIMAHKPIYRWILVDLYGKYVPTLRNRLRHGTADVRVAARAELERLGMGGMKALLDALADPKDPVRRRIAVDVLGYLDNKAAVAPLIRLARETGGDELDPTPASTGTMKATPDIAFHVDALVAAGRLGDPRAVAQVLPLVNHDEVAVREAAVYTLARTGDKTAVAPLLAALDDHRPSVAALACLGLGGIADHAALTAATTRLTDRTAPDAVRAACAVGLAHAGAAAVPALVEAVGDNAGETQRLAAWALGVAGDRSATGALLAAYVARVGGDRSTIVWALARLAGAPPGPPVDVDDYPMRASKLDLGRLLRELPGELPEVVPPAELLVGRTDDVAGAVQRALEAHRDEALAVLGDLDGRDEGIGLGELTAGPLSPAATAALAAIGRAIEPAVRAHVDDPDPKVAGRALSVLAKIGGSDAVPAVTAGLAAGPRPVWTAAVQAIATLERRGQGTPALRAALSALCASRDSDQRDVAVQAEGAMGQAADVPVVIALVRDPNGWVREHAAAALGAIGDRSAVEPLLAATHDDVDEVRAAAAAALRLLGDPRAKARLDELAADPHEAAVVRDAAAGKRPATPAP
ncbi:MAG TPA: HEAT repeat domain-containing protein [Kofleriaceae bacterium]|nr:HEAT repeat domain-containing protein [Kofleriaceae bacterium]